MIYRKWSLLTGPAVMVGGVGATLVALNFIFFKQDPFAKPPEKKQDSSAFASN